MDSPFCNYSVRWIFRTAKLLKTVEPGAPPPKLVECGMVHCFPSIIDGSKYKGKSPVFAKISGNFSKFDRPVKKSAAFFAGIPRERTAWPVVLNVK